jgi:signal transduction histidine kinase
MVLLAAHVAALALTTVVTLAVAVWVRRRSEGPASAAFVALLVLDAAWPITQLGGLLAPAGARRLIFYISIVPGLPISIAWFVFTVYYTDRGHWLTARVWGTMGALVVFSPAVYLTNDIHGLGLTSLEWVATPFPHFVPTYGPIYWLLFSVSYLLIAVGLGLLVGQLLTARHVSRTQLTALVVAAIPPTLLSLANFGGLLPVDGFRYTSLGIGLFSGFAAWAIYGHQLFDVRPIARDTVVENLDDAVLTVDERYLLVDYNDTARQQFPNLVGEFGRPLPALVPDLFVEQDPPELATEVTTFVDGDRQRFTVDPTPLGDTGDPDGYAIVLSDVTELERYARDLEQQTEQLEQVTGTLSHDLRNPLSVARGAVTLAVEDGDIDELARAQRSFDRMDDIIEGALTLAREGRAPDSRTLCSLQAVATDAWETTDTGVATFECDSPEDVRVYADPSRLRTVLENLFRNAVDHGTPAQADGDQGASRGAGVTVRVATTDDGFVVSDDGPGVPEDERDEVFEYGYTDAEDGSGLGLSIVQSIAQAHDWTAEVADSDLGGACFRFSSVTLVHEDGDGAVADSEAG